MGGDRRVGEQITGSLSSDKAMALEFRQTIGEDADDFVWNLRWHGHYIIRERVKKYDIDCDLKFDQMQTARTQSHMDELRQIHDEGLARGMEKYLSFLNTDDVGEVPETDLYCDGRSASRPAPNRRHRTMRLWYRLRKQCPIRAPATN